MMEPPQKWRFMSKNWFWKGFGSLFALAWGKCLFMWFQWLVINWPYSNNDPKWNKSQNLVFDLKNISWKFGVKIQMFTRVPLSEKDVFGAISSFPFIWIWPWFHNITKAGTSLKIKIYAQKITLKSFWVISCHWIRYPAVYVILVVGNKLAIF